MVIENAIITIDPEKSEAFEATVSKAVDIFRASDGCQGLALQRIVDEPGRYRLLVQWETMAHHKPQFWASEGFQQWRTLVADYFVGTPTLEYNEVVATYF